MQSQPTIREGHGRRVAVQAIGLVALVVLVVAGAVEGTFRFVLRPSAGFATYLFHVDMNVARWSFLAENHERVHRDVGVRSLTPSFDMVRGVEADRPPYDRVEWSFRVRTNEAGFRDVSFSPAKREGTLRVIAVGDSVTFGWGVENDERYTDRLRALLPASVELQNAGVCGATSATLEELVARALEYDPDLILYKVPANDYDQTLWHLSEQSSWPGPGLWALRLLSMSRTLLALDYLLFGDAQARYLQQATTEAGVRYKENLERTVAMLRKRGVPMVALSVPYSTGEWHDAHVFEVCDRNPDVCLGRTRASFDDVDRRCPACSSVTPRHPAGRDYVALTAARLGLREEDLAPVFPLRELFSNIVHPNAKGHHLIALSVRDLLLERWLDPATGRPRAPRP